MLKYFIFSRAKEKAANIVEHIGYPSELMEVNKLEELYDGLHINSTHYLGNALSMTVFGTNYAFSKLREKVSTKTFTKNRTANAIYWIYLGGTAEKKN